MVLKPTPNCKCTPTCNPDCDTLKVVQNHIATNCVIKFLKGFNDLLEQVRSQILMMKPLPNIEEAFSTVVQFGRQKRNAMNQMQGGVSSFMPNVASATNVSAVGCHSTLGGVNGQPCIMARNQILQIQVMFLLELISMEVEEMAFM